jgi:hypothetical protein
MNEEKGYMTAGIVSSGSELALSVAPRPFTTAPIYIVELLASINRKDGTQESMIHAVAARFLEFLGAAAELFPLTPCMTRRIPSLLT